MKKDIEVPIIPPRNVPIIPPREVMPPTEPNPVEAICGACGLEMRREMCYSCPRDDCPCYMRVTC